MPANDQYKTIEMPCEGIFKDKGSRFIAYAYPVYNEAEVKELLQHLKKEHHSARHHCYAYRLGNKGENYRSNDDGEPSGTAGKPILGQLLSKDLTNIVVFVVRYFGGTLLGVSGLINAYKNATIEVLANATICTRVVQVKLTIIFDYMVQNNVMKIIKDEQLEVIDTCFGLRCQISFFVRQNKTDEIIGKISKIDGVKIEKD